MKFIVNSQVFSKQLASISGILSNNNTVPIINCFHFHLEGNTLTVKTTDLMTTLMTKITVDTSDGNSSKDLAVPASLLLNILKNLDDSPITFESDESNYTIVVTSGEGKYRLAGRNPETYPDLPSVEATSRITMPASVLVSAITMTSFAASNDEESHQQLSGILLEMGPEYTTFVATDGHKLVRYRRTDITSDEPARFIMPRKPINIVKGILSSNKEDVDVNIEYNNTNVLISFGNHVAICRLIDGKYPNYEAAIPKDQPNKMVVDRTAFLSTLRRVMLFANQATCQVRLSISNDFVMVASEDIEFSNSANEKLSCAYEGSEMEIGFNAKFLTEMMSCLNTEQVEIDLASPLKPGIILPMNNSDEGQQEQILMLVMPVSLSY